MIDKAIFARLMLAFGERINRPPLSPDASAMYYAAFSEKLTTEEFQTAMQRTFSEHAFNTWPAPGEIVARVKPDAPKLNAVAAWSALEIELARDEWSRNRAQLSASCGDLTLNTLEAIGGARRWVHGNEFVRGEMRREFLACYGDMQRLPGEQQAALLRHVDDRPRRLTGNGATRIGAIAPYSPGDPEHD